MPVAVGTSPNLVAADLDFDTFSTATFSPPADALLVAALVGFKNVATEVISNTVTPRTWVPRLAVDDGTREVRFWTADNPTALTNITVGMNDPAGGTEYWSAALKVWVVTGHDPANPVGQTGNGSSGSNAVTVNGYTSSRANSRGFCAASCNGSAGVPTSTDTAQGGNVTSDVGDFGLLAIMKAANTGSSGSVVTFNLDAAGTDATTWRWGALEIVPPLDPSRPMVVTPVGAAHRAASW